MTDFTAYLRLGVDSRDAVKAQKDLDGMAKAGDRSDKSFKQLSGTTKILRGSIGGIGLAAATSQVINYADAWTNVSNVLMGVSDSSAAYAVNQSKVLALSKNTFSSLEATSRLYSEITRSVTELGVSQDRVIGVTRTINNLFLAGGKSAQAAAGAILQLNQGFASGVLRGDEFNSVAEGAPRILDALTQKLGITKGELRAFAATGGITAEILIDALEDYAAEAQRLVDITDRTFSQSAELARTFALEFVGASEGIKEFSATAGSALVTVAQNLDLVSDAVTVLAVAYGARLLGSITSATAAKVTSIAATRAQAVAENEAAVGIARRATVEALAAKETLDRARAESIAATATVNTARANGIATQSVAPLIVALNAQAVAQQRLTSAVGGSAAATAAASAANARLAATNAAVAGTTALATAARAAGAAMALIGGPVGVAVLAGAAIYYFATQASEAEKIVEKLNPEVDGLIERFNALGQAQQQLARQELAEKVREQSKAVEDLNNQLARQQALMDMQSSPFTSASMGGGGQVRVSAGDLTNTRAQIEAAEQSLAKLQGQFDTVKKTTAQINSEMKTFADSFGTLNELAGRFITGDGVSAAFSMFRGGTEDVKTFSAEYKKLSADIEKQIALFGDEKKSSELAYMARTGQLKEVSAEEAALLVTRYQALEQLEETADKTKELNEAEKSRAESVASSIAELEKQNSLFGDQSKYADILYDINNGLLIVTESERARYLAAAEAADQLAANKALADSIDDFSKKSDEDKAALDSLIESVDEFGGAWTRTGSIVADSLGTMADALADYSAQMAAIAKKEDALAKARAKAYGDPKAIAKIASAEKKLASDRASATISSYGQMAGAAASMFKEQSKGREALNKAEQVFTAIEIALALKKAAANSLTAITSAFSAPFPVNFAAGAAMIAIMAGLGVFSGGGGSGSAPTAADIQASQGTGTVMGDPDGKSESILNSFEMYEDIALDQLSELRGIRDAMTGLSAGIAQLAVSLVSGQRFSGNNIEGLGKVTAISQSQFLQNLTAIDSPFVSGLTKKIAQSLFGSTRKSLRDTGLQIGAQDLGDILSGDLSVLYYNTIEVTKKKLFGLSKKVTITDEFSAADSALVDQFDQIFGFIGTAVTESLGVLGLESANAIESFRVNIGKVSFKDLSGDEIQSELNAIFSQQADLIAEFVVPAMKDFQQIGEGLFETLARVAMEVATFNSYVDLLGLNFNVTGLAAISAQQSIADFSGGMDRLTASLQSYYEEFFSEEERAANQMRLLSAEMQSLGYDTVPTSREAFRELVEGIDLTTEAGQKQFAALLELSGVFAELVPATEAATESFGRLAQSAFDAVKDAVSAERARIQGIVAGANTAKQALDRSVSAEKKEIDDAYKARMDQLQSLASEERKTAEANANAQNEAQRALAQARIEAINQEKSEVEERIGGLKSLFEQLTSAASDIAPKTNASIMAARRLAEMEIDTAIRNASAGRGLPTDGRLDTALQTVRSNPAEAYASAQERDFSNAVITGKINNLAGYAGRQLTIEEQTLAMLERQLESAQTASDTFVEFTAVSSNKYDEMISAAKAQYDNDVAGLNLITQNAQDQIDALTGIDSRTLSVEEALAAFNESMLAADFENAQEQYERLDGILEQGQLQLDTLLDIDAGVLSLRDAIDRFAEAVTSVDQTRANQELLEEMRRTADELHQLREEQRVQAITQQSTLNETARNTRITANEAMA